MRSILILSVLTAPVLGDHCRVQRNVVHADTGLTIVPYAVGVAVPVVGLQSQPLYSVNPAYSQSPQQQAAPVDERAKLIADVIAVLEARQKQQAAPAVTLFGKTCASCHGPDSTHPKAALARKHVQTENMTLDSIDEAEDALLHDRMPPNAKQHPVDGAVAGGILREFSAMRKALKAGKAEVQSLPKAPPPEPKKEQ
jgi:mono/diheme cytochrome c family protein